MSGVQSVLNHLRFARHWLAKAENEFQRQESVQGELSLSLVEAEVRKAWTESRRAMRLIAFPGRAGRTGHPARAALGIGLALLAVALGGVGAFRLARLSSPPRLLHPPALPGTAPREVAQVAGLPPRPAQSPKPRIAATPEAPPVPAAQAAQVVQPATPLEKLPERAGERPTVQPEETGQPSRVEAAEAPVSPPAPVAPAPVAPAPAAPAAAAPAVPVAATGSAPSPAVPAASAPPAPNPAIAGEGGGTPLPLDLVELVRIAERSLTGRP